MTGIAHELRLAARALAKSPGFALTAGGILALGLGLAMFMFSAVNAYILRPLPFEDADRLVHLEHARPAEGRNSMEVSIHDFLDYREEQTLLENLAAFSMGTVNLSDDEGAERFDGAFMTASAFDVLSVQPALGRGFVAGDDAPGAETVVLLGHTLWTHRYGSDPGVLGSTLRVNGRPATIIGVMPPGFRFPRNEDVWSSLSLDVRDLKRGDGTSLEVFGKLNPGVSLEQARAEFAAIAARLAERHPETNAGVTSVLKPYAEEFVDRGARASIFTMFATVLLVLLVACANVANLILARNAGRRRELAIRGALGAGRARVVTLVLAECLLVSAIGGITGYWLADVAGAYMMDVIRQVETFAPPYWVEIRPDSRTVLFALGIALVATLAAGLVPALRASRTDVIEDLRQGGQGIAGSAMGRLTRAFVVTQVAFSCVVLVCSGLMARSVIEQDRIDVNADTDGVLTGRLGLFEATYPTKADRVRFMEQLAEKLASLPGVEAATLTSSLPGTFVGSRYVLPQDVEVASGGEHPWAYYAVTAPNYFEMFGVPVTGRPFAKTDHAEAQPVVIVNQMFAERFWPGSDPLGRRVRLGKEDSEEPWQTVVGVVPNVVQNEVDEPMRPTVYVPLAQTDPRFMSLAVRSEGDPFLQAEPVRAAVRALDPDVPVYWQRTLEQWIDMGRFAARFVASLFVSFGIVALLLGAAGLYAVLAQTVSLRTREIGLRRALGALDPQLVRMLLREASTELALGLAIGLLLSAGFAQFLSDELIGVQAFDPATYGGVSLVLALAALLAAVVPARRAIAVDPLVALRAE